MPIRHVHELKPNVFVQELRDCAGTAPAAQALRLNEAANLIEYLQAELDGVQDIIAERDEPRARDTYPEDMRHG